jgi:dihydroflavonol-4-reductase
VSEDQRIDPNSTALEYGRSKALGIIEVLNAAWNDMDCIVCCPTAFIGPPDYRRSPLGQVISDYLNGKLPAYVSGGFDWADVRDVADGLIRAAEWGRPGGIYLLPGHYATVPELMELLESVSGVRRPRLCLPHFVLKPFMPAIEWYYHMSGRPPQFTRGSLKILGLNVRVDGSLARRELGYRPRPLEETLADTVEWFRREAGA